MAALALPASASAAVNPQLTNTRLKSDVSSIKTLIKLAPNTTAGKRFESRLLSHAALVNRMLAKGDPCGARTPLRSLRLAAKSSSPLPLAARADLIAESLNAESILLQRSSTSECGGAKKPPGTARSIVVQNASATELKVRVTMPPAQFDGVDGAGKPFASVGLDGLATDGTPGQPGMPGMTLNFAIPQGAKTSVSQATISSYTIPSFDPAPVQADALDADPPAGPDVTSEDPRFKRPDFAFTPSEYAKTARFPSSLVTIGPGAQTRNLNLGRLTIFGAQRAGSKVRIPTVVEVTIKFEGGTGKFGTTELTSPENTNWQQIYASSVLNYPAVIKNLSELVLSLCGEDVLIITTPALRAQADRLATQKRARGFTTNVFETGSAAVGSTADSIKAFVKTRFFNGNCSKRIDYLILFGKSIPTHYKTYGEPIANDFEYSLMIDPLSNGLDFPFFAVGRIPADTEASAQTMVDKIIQYENAPPADASYYQKAAIAGEFQWDDGCGAGCNNQREARTFVTAAEAVRTSAVGGGKVVDRLYKKQAGATPKKFNDGTALPGAILEPGFAWTANNTSIATAINDGRFLVFHRDHGGINGWSTPNFNTTDINGLLTNANELPLVWSINCSTGRFDGASFSFAEQFVRKSGGGAAAVIAASRDSPSLTNTLFSKALANTAFRNVPGLPGGTPILPIGDAMNQAKIWLYLYYAATVGADSAKKELRLYNVIGDPTLPLRLTKPA